MNETRIPFAGANPAQGTATLRAGNACRTSDFYLPSYYAPDAMRKPRRAEFTPLDFAGWKADSSLLLTPKFQRRSVWKPPARSFFIDSLLRGMPVPPIYLRERQSPERDRMLREVVDGQQRISAVLDFMEGKFRLAKNLDKAWANKTFKTLTEDQKDSVSTYPFSVEIFHGISDAEVLEIFSRLNTYSVSLNKQELRNGRFFGPFKQSVYTTAHQYLEFWRRHHVFTETNIARMHEVEFVSELFILFLDGIQDKKSSIDEFYQQFDEDFPKREQVETRFGNVVGDINDTVGDILPSLAFRRPPMLYSLFCALYHRRFGLPECELPTPKKVLNADERLAFRGACEKLSAAIEAARNDESIPRELQAFVNASLQQTDNERPRLTRLHKIYTTAFN